MPTTLHNELIALTRLAEVARVADVTPDYRRGLETPLEWDIIGALNASPELGAALGFQPATRWGHGYNLFSDVVGVSESRSTFAELKAWSRVHINSHGQQLDVIEGNARDDDDLVLIVRSSREPKFAADLGEDTRWRILTLAAIAAACERLLLSEHLTDVTGEASPLFHQAIREQALMSARIAI